MLQKPLFSKVFISGSSPQQELCEFFLGFFFSTNFWFLRISYSIQQFFEVSPEKGLCFPAHQTPPLLNWTHLPLLSLLSWRRDAVYKHNLSCLNGSSSPKTPGQLFLEDAKNSIYGQSKQKSSARKAECNA